MKIKYTILLLVSLFLVGSLSAQISETVLKQGWYVLPWEVIREQKPTGDVTLKDIKNIVTIELLSEIKQNLPERIKKVSVNTAMQQVINRNVKKKLCVVLEEEIHQDTGLCAVLDQHRKYFKFHFGSKQTSNLRPQDIYFIFCKNEETQEIEVLISTRLNVNLKISKQCCYCCGASCLLVGAGVCAAACAAVCWACSYV